MTHVVLDANVLYGQSSRNFMMYLGLVGALQLHWTMHILDECFRSLQKRRPDIDANKLERTRVLMNQHQPRALVTGYEHLIDGLVLPDMDDRHVLAAAIHAEVQWIVTYNIKDFPPSVLGPLDIGCIQPDKLVELLIEGVPDLVMQALTGLQQAKKNPPRTMHETMERLANNGFSNSMSRLILKTRL